MLITSATKCEISKTAQRTRRKCSFIYQSLSEMSSQMSRLNESSSAISASLFPSSLSMKWSLAAGLNSKISRTRGLWCASTRAVRVLSRSEYLRKCMKCKTLRKNLQSQSCSSCLLRYEWFKVESKQKQMKKQMNMLTFLESVKQREQEEQEGEEDKDPGRFTMA